MGPHLRHIPISRVGATAVSGWMLVLATSALALEWTDWEWVNPLPQGYRLTAVTRGSGMTVAVGAEGTILASGDGEVWDIPTSGNPYTLTDVVWTGSLFVAVGGDNGGETPRFGVVLSSPDGYVWTERHRVLGVELWAVHWNGHQILAVGEPGITLASSDGTAWVEHHLGGDLGESVMWDLAWDGSEYLAVGLEYNPFPSWPASGNPSVFASSDGASWTRTPLDNPSGHDERYVAVTWGHGVFVAVGDGETPIVSEDGVSWTTAVVSWPHAGQRRGFSDIAFADGRFAAVRRGSFAVSDDGLSWTAYDAPYPPLPSVDIWGLCHVDDGYLVVGSLGFMAFSANGHEWSEIGSLQWIANVADLCRHDARYFGVAEYGVISSDDGHDWTVHDLFVAAAREPSSIRSIDGSLWITGFNGGILRSADGVTWEIRHDPEEGEFAFFDIAGSGEMVVATGFEWVPQGGGYPIMAASPDGSNWIYNRLPGDHPQMLSIVWTGQRFVAVGRDGTVSTSINGLSWTSASLDENVTFQRIAWSGEKMVAIGRGILATSRDGLDWELVEMPDARPGDVAWTGRQFVAPNLNRRTGAEILTSRDGLTWHANPAGFGFLASCVEGDGHELIVGSGTSILRADHASSVPRRGGRRVLP